MTFLHISLLHIFSFLFYFIYVDIIWRIHYSGFYGSFNFSSLRSYNVLHPIWPDDPEFWGLKFSALRHAIIPLLFSALVWFVNLKWLNTLCFWLSLLYSNIGLHLYHSRRANYKNALKGTEAPKSFLKPVKSLCFWLRVHSYVNYFIFIICYALRP